MNKVLILGAGLMQEPAIRAAHGLGYETIVFDVNPHAHCVPLCTQFYAIDLKDTDTLVAKATEIHQKTPLSAVFTAGTDFSFAVASVAKACNVLGHSTESAERASDKIRMRSCFETHGISSPSFTEVTKATERSIVKDFVQLHEYPLVVKPTDNMGGRGCRLARNKDELKDAITDAIKNSKTERAIVEEYMEGPEFSIDALVCNGEVTITGFADRHIFFPPYFIEMGHSIPTRVSEKEKTALIETFVKGIKALGLTHGSAKADIKLTKNGPMVGEIAARLSGGYMSGWTFPLSSGLNLTKQALLIALGKETPELYEKRKFLQEINGLKVYDYPCNKHCVERAWLSIPGRLKSNQDISYELPMILPRLQKGDCAEFPVNNVTKAGNLIAVGKTREEALSKAHDVLLNQFVALQDNEKSTIDFLAQDVQTEFPPSAYKNLLKNPKILEQLSSDVISLEKILQNMSLELTQLLEIHANDTDWNGLTLNEAMSFITHYVTSHDIDIAKSEKDFLQSLARGGVQGALFSNF